VNGHDGAPPAEFSNALNRHTEEIAQETKDRQTAMKEMLIFPPDTAPNRATHFHVAGRLFAKTSHLTVFPEVI
jgi:hypothetical protein